MVKPPLNAQADRRRWLQFRLSTLLIVITALSVVLGWELRRRRTNAALNNESRCRANLLMIAMAMHDYHADYGSFPPRFVADEAGRPAHSWRTLILPYIDQGRQLYSQYRFDEPWDAPENRRLLAARPEIFHCPADDRTAKNAGKTNYFVVSGNDTVFPDGQSVRLADLSDSDATILIVESIGLDVDWLEPKDLESGAFESAQGGAGGAGISCHHVHRCNVALANGNPKLLRLPLSKEDISTLLSIHATSSEKRAALDRQAMPAGQR